MAIGESGYVDFEDLTGSRFVFRVFWSEDYDVAANSSSASVTDIQIKAIDSNFQGNWYPGGTVSVNGEIVCTLNFNNPATHTISVTTSFKSLRTINQGKPFPWVSGAISHEPDGSKSVSVELALSMYADFWEDSWGAYPKVTGSKAIALTTIPSASTLDTLSCTTSYFTGKLTYIYTPKSASHYNRCEIVLNQNGNHTAVKAIPLGKKAAAQQTGTVTLTADELGVIYNELPDATKGTLRFNLYTYSDSGYSTQVGNVSHKEITLTVPDDSTTKPKLSMSITPEGMLPAEFEGLYIKGKTRVKAVFEATSVSSVIKSYELLVSGMVTAGNPVLSAYLPVSGEVKVTGTVTDARGYSASVTQTITVIPYDMPRVVPCNGQNMVVCERCLADGTPDAGGLNLLIKAGRTYSPVAVEGVQKNFCTLRYRYKTAGGEAFSDWISLIKAEEVLNDEANVVAVGIVPSAMTAYHVQIGVLDALGGQPPEMDFIIPTDEVAFHLRAGGKGAAFGMYAQADYRLELEPEWILALRGHLMEDFVVEQGTSGGWFFRKWYSGIGECWITADAAPDSFPIDYVETPKRFSNAAFGGTGHDIYVFGMWK